MLLYKKLLLMTFGTTYVAGIKCLVCSRPDFKWGLHNEGHQLCLPFGVLTITMHDSHNSH